MDKNFFLVVLLSVFWFALIIISYYNFDFKLAMYINIHFSNPHIVKWANILSNLALSSWWLISLLVVSLIARYLYHNYRLAWQAFYLWLNVSVSGIAALILKTLLGRPRPYFYLHNHLAHFSFLSHPFTAAGLYEYASFPSGHATTITALGVGFFLLAPIARVGVVLIISAVALARLLSLHHFLSDVMAGIYLGALVAVVLYKLLYDYLHKEYR